MRGLAEFVMKGRKQAIMAVMLLGIVPLANFLSPVVVGLVLLRKGLREAAIIMAWAILPIGAWAIAGDMPPLITLLGVSGLALLLRETESWELTLVAAIVVGVCVEGYLKLQPAILDRIFEEVELYLATNSLPELQIDNLRELVTSLFGAVYMCLSIVLLMLSRWMQAALFNPGGFQREFHALRVEQKVALLLLVLMVMANFGIVLPETWVMYFVLPLVFSGVALVHGLVAKLQMSGIWLTTFYFLMIFSVVIQLTVLMALVDSWYNFRQRANGPTS
jgi:hypothetical protein